MRNKWENESGFSKAVDPAVLLAGASVLTLAIACCSTFAAAVFSLVLALAALPLSGISIKRVGIRLLAVNAFIVPLFLVVPFTSPAPYLWQYGVIKLSKPGLELCILAGLKSNAIVMLLLALVAPMPVSAFGSALRRLGCPDKLAWMFLLMDCNLHLLGNVWRKLSEAASLRGFKPGTSIHCYRTYAALITIFFLRAHDRSNVLREALLLAGSEGRIPFSSSWRFAWPETLFSTAILTCAFLILAVI